MPKILVVDDEENIVELLNQGLAIVLRRYFSKYG